MSFRTNLDARNTDLCVPGLTILAAIKLVEQAHHLERKTLVINIGSIDILNGEKLADMCWHFKRLIVACEKKRIRPVISTLAPLVNLEGSSELSQILHLFNNHLLDTYFANVKLIDIWSQMVLPSGGPLSGLFDR